MKKIILLIFSIFALFIIKIRFFFLKRNIIRVKNNIETINKIVGGSSIIRFGDGELMIMKGGNIKNYQNFTDNLQKKLIESFQNSENNYIIGIPYVFDNDKNLNLKTKLYWSQYLLRNYSFLKKILDKNSTYYSCQVTRVYINSTNPEDSQEVFSLWKDLFKNKNILVVEGSMSKIGIGNNLLEPALSINRIVCPYKDAFEKYSEIYEFTLEYIHANNPDLVLFSLGPTATVLAAEISNNTSVQCIDVGNLDSEYSWYISKAKKRTSLQGKRIYELENDEFSELLSDEADLYNSQIIKQIQ